TPGMQIEAAEIQYRQDIGSRHLRWRNLVHIRQNKVESFSTFAQKSIGTALGVLQCRRVHIHRDRTTLPTAGDPGD
ncbi:MAG: hypothetical protein KDI60_10720, partial [Xanthomonadales bacterium]|nr:hypothetical protein [Xanthomonadales bacterium]